MVNGKVADENGRIAALHRYSVLDTEREQPFDKITELVSAVLEVPISLVSLVDTDRQWFKSARGLSVSEMPRCGSFCNVAITQDEPLVVNNALQDTRFRMSPLVSGDPHIRSYAGVPLQTSDGYNIGSLCAIDTVPRDFSAAQISILASFASLVVDELELRLIAERDYLTGALTRRGFIEQAKKEIARFERHGRTSVIALFDIDHFKSVNDRRGHAAGDEVLVAVSEACQQLVRANDAFGRLGGEEFAFLITETDLAGAMIAAEKFRQAIADLAIGSDEAIKVTASFGIAPLSRDIATPEDWIARADEALYASKRGGRNRCSWYCGELSTAAA